MALISNVLRDRARKQELEQIKDRLKSNLPVLTRREIRRFRIPYHEALCLELEEDGYFEASMFLNLLIEFQQQMREENGPESWVWFYPQLINEKDKLDILYHGLKAAEDGKLAVKFGVESAKILELGVHFSNEPVGWWWLAKQLFLQAVDCASTFRDDGGRIEAVCRHILGRFYLNQLNEVENAVQQLKHVREKSNGKSKWNCSNELGIPQESLFVECCTLLYRAYLIQAKELIDTDPVKAVKICQIAQNRAKDANDEKGISECLLQLGICELRTGNANTALIKFNKVLAMSLSAQSPERICEARIQIALAKSRLGNIAEANYHLESLLEYASTNDLRYYYAQAHRFLGELYLNQGRPALSTPLLVKAVDIFNELNDWENIELVKNLAAISAGQELLGRYVRLILSCENNSEKEMNLMQLVKWKNAREHFWNDNDDDIDELSDYLQASIVPRFPILPPVTTPVSVSETDDSSTLVTMTSEQERLYAAERSIANQIDKNMFLNKEFFESLNVPRIERKTAKINELIFLGEFAKVDAVHKQLSVEKKS